MVEKEHLVFSTSLAQGVNGADAALIGLGPLPHEDESADAMLCLTQWTEFHRAK